MEKENKDEQLPKMTRRALFYTNTAFILADVANTMANFADSKLRRIGKYLDKDDKRLFGLAQKSAFHAKVNTAAVAKRIYQIPTVDNVCEDSDYLMKALLLIIDRTAENAESQKEMLNYLRAKPSLMNLNDWLEDNPDFLGLENETD